VTAILVGLLAALLWGIAGLVNGRASRLVGAPLAVAWALLTGALIMAVLAGASGWPEHAERADWLWAFAAGVGTIGGLLLSYESYRRGKLGVVAPIVATQGAIAAVLAVAVGEPLGAASGVALIVIVIGVVIAAGGEPAEEGVERRERKSLAAPLIALAGAASFGFGLFSASQVGDALNPFWVAFVPRVLGLVAVVVPVAMRGGLRLPRPVWPLAAVGGALEVSGLVAFVVAARDDAAIAAVMASQFAIVTALGGYLLWGEKIGRVQVAGVCLVLAGVAGLTLVQT
jgi:drug/metabolite transporter (DMT)-like permease